MKKCAFSSFRTSITYYYSFKIFFRFWLVKTTCIIHHNQLLFTKFGKNLRHIESMTSKVQPAENYWTNDFKMASKVQPAADYWTIDRENLGTRLCCIWWVEIKERNGETPLRRRKYFEWIIKQLLNLAFVGYGEFCRSRRVLQWFQNQPATARVLPATWLYVASYSDHNSLLVTNNLGVASYL